MVSIWSMLILLIGQVATFCPNESFRVARPGPRAAAAYNCAIEFRELSSYFNGVCVLFIPRSQERIHENLEKNREK
jgi:hypothetical protein